MDVPLAPPVAKVLREAIDIGDTGYASRHGYADAVAGFASARWGWHDLPVADSRVLPDVMTGIVEVLRVSTDPRDVVIVTSPVYAPFFSYVERLQELLTQRPSGRLAQPQGTPAPALQTGPGIMLDVAKTPKGMGCHRSQRSMVIEHSTCTGAGHRIGPGPPSKPGNDSWAWMTDDLFLSRARPLPTVAPIQ